MMFEQSSSQSFFRLRESAFWATAVEQTLKQYDLSLRHSSVGGCLFSEQFEAEGFIDQQFCSLIWSEATRIADDPLLGLRMHRVFSPTAFNTLALAASASPTIGDALNLLTRYFPIVSTQLTLKVEMQEDTVQLLLRPIGETHPQHMASITGYLARYFTRIDLDGEGLLFAIQLADHHQLHEHSCKQLLKNQVVSFADHYTLSLKRALLSKTLPTASSLLLPKLTEILQHMLATLPSSALSEQVKRRIHLLLGSGDISAERVAGPMNISQRHLRRKLSQEGTSYEQLADEVRREAALRMIADGQLSLTSIAYELGFLDPSSFTRAFRRWTDMSPTAYRRELSKKSPAVS
ncbi:helix-turn-helix domain-containing protein [Halopseudomonas sabulinigri]|uniref:AraC family transcriptional regulator n=1 Tax=Halopseudomonas sabulinigri TaxID=472181 RepID=A0ABP9ZM78_9GAMM